MTGFPALTKKELLWTLLGLLLLFLFVNGPVWEGPWDATPSIVYSYLPIPLVIAALLWGRKRLKPLPWLLHTLELVFAKFMVTALFLLGLWVWRGNPPPPDAVPAPEQAASRVPKPLPAATVFAPDQVAQLRGTLKDAHGIPVRHALVFVAEGLAPWVFNPSSGDVTLLLEPEGYVPSEAAVQVGQPLLIQSKGQALHTAQALGPTGPLFNLPVLAKGEARHVFGEPATSVRIRCTVHGKPEREAVLHVLSHPFFTRTDEAGRFLLSNVPKRAELRLRFEHEGRSVELSAQAGDSVEASFPGS